MRAVKNALSFGAMGLIIAIAAAYLASLHLHFRSPDNRTNLSMDVPDVKGLVVGSNVLLRGVSVGKVTKVETTLGQATVDFYVDGRQRVPVDSDIRLDNLSALGETYIGLIPHTDSGPMLTNGQRISTERVVVPPSISELATSVVRVLNQSDPQQLSSITKEADEALPDPEETLPNLVRASQLLNQMVGSMNGDGQRVLGNAQTLLQNAGWVGPTLARLGPEVGSAGDSLGATFHSMMSTVVWDNPRNMKLFGKFLQRIQDFLDSRGGDIKVLTQALTPQFQGIGGALMNIDTGQMLSNVLAGIPEDGAITLHVKVPDQ
ncbi:hypothetical protein MANY_42090 [Mycolicibacterium anyangense]|uniref:Mce/MlaD domain-containing protein n=1 Tax=Mycolicibacterium anyangense TaxID=1431246 RepID=A0A6N4WG20_9MYCO|nr:MlaD family protein [Mycolicibacterium anyangense]BBZ78872.1 hypothetical protein MANY_42090 [Mycolicibacterium anyangense]